MKSLALGESTSPVEVSNISPHGFWLLLGDEELFVPFSEFPWFREATVRQISQILRLPRQCIISFATRSA
jgi:hypothetical protein